MMGYHAKSKAEVKRALASKKAGNPENVHVLDFRANVIETSFFGNEARVPGENTVVFGGDPERIRNSFGTLTVNEHGIVTAVR